MMMQHDTGPMPPNALAQETVDAVRRALERHGAGASTAEPTPELRAALLALAREARLKGVPPEHLLTTLKTVWRALPVIEKLRDHTEQTRALQRIVTICIKEYFAG